MSDDNLEEFLQACAASLNYFVREAICEYFPGKRGDGHASALAFEYLAKVLEITVASTHARLVQFECGNVGATDYLVVSVHVAADAMSSRIADLAGGIHGLHVSIDEDFAW